MGGPLLYHQMPDFSKIHRIFGAEFEEQSL